MEATGTISWPGKSDAPRLASEMRSRYLRLMRRASRARGSSGYRSRQVRHTPRAAIPTSKPIIAREIVVAFPPDKALAGAATGTGVGEC